MFQNTRSPAAQERLNQEQQKQAQDTTAETQKRMESELQSHTAQVQRQTIEGKIHDIRVNERAGATKQDVITRTEQNLMGTVDFDLSLLKPPSIIEDRRGEYREKIQKAIKESADLLLAQKEETVSQRREDEQRLLERQSEVRINEQEVQAASSRASRNLAI
jgi:hypothetical protein